MSKKSDGKKSDRKKVDRENAKMSRKAFEAELIKLQTELCRLQDWVKHEGARIIIVFEGRDAAGKGGVIKRITERVSPRVFRVVALPAPTEREKTQIYAQRYISHFPAAGEIILFDRSWYNRAGVERVMGFCTEHECERFLQVIPNFERELVDQGIILIKYFFDVSQEEQERRFRRRIDDPMRQWKLSPMDLESYKLWWNYTAAYNDMFSATDTDYAPWYIVEADDKRRARLNCIAHLLSVISYKKVPFEKPSLGKRLKKPKDVPDRPLFRHVVPSGH
jgi:polyphosphate kinase